MNTTFRQYQLKPCLLRVHAHRKSKFICYLNFSHTWFVCKLNAKYSIWRRSWLFGFHLFIFWLHEFFSTMFCVELIKRIWRFSWELLWSPKSNKFLSCFINNFQRWNPTCLVQSHGILFIVVVLVVCNEHLLQNKIRQRD